MSLFTELLRLHGVHRPTEDFFTEIVAVLLRRQPGLAVEWLTEMGVDDLGGKELTRVETQVFVPASEEAGASRLDLHLALEGGGQRMIVMIESKVGSKESQNQLRTYASHLAKIQEKDRWLIYVTRDYDPKCATDITHGASVRFEQSRWATFYAVLKKYRGDDLVDETLAFMKEQKMQRIDRIDATDILAIQGMPRAFSFMDQVLAGAVAQANKGDSSWLPANLSAGWSDTRLRDRYVCIHELKPKLNLLFGFVFDREGEEPRLEVTVEAAPSIENRHAVLESLMQASQEEGEWEPYNLDGASAWSGIRASQSIFLSLSESSHLNSMQEFLAARLGEVKEMQDETSAFR